jgi:hypothetical protein
MYGLDRKLFPSYQKGRKERLKERRLKGIKSHETGGLASTQER